MPLWTRSTLSATRFLIPGTGWSSERVAIRPITQGTRTATCVFCSRRSGKPKTVKLAGGVWVSHIASMAAIFIFWFCEAV